MRQVKFWAIVPVALLAAFSGKPLLASPIFQPAHVSSSFSSSESFQIAQESPIPSPSASPSPSPSPSPSVQPSPSQPSPSPRPASPSPSSSPTSSKVILEQKGELSQATSSVLNSDGSLYNQHTFDGRQGEVVNLTLESADFDTYLAVFDSAGKLLGENDDVGENCNYQDERGKKDFIGKGLCNSQLNVTLPTNGSYKVIVNGHDRTDRGKYTLIIRDMGNK